MALQTFVQLRLPAAHMAFGSLTGKPGRTADVLVEAIICKPAIPCFRSFAILQGVQGEDVRNLAAELHARYMAASRLDAQRGRLVFEIEHDRLHESLVGTLTAFQAAFGPTWLHFARGHLTARAQALQDPQESARRLRQALRIAGIKGRVQVVRLEDADLSVWRQLAMWRASAEGSREMLLPVEAESHTVPEPGKDA